MAKKHYSTSTTASCIASVMNLRCITLLLMTTVLVIIVAQDNEDTSTGNPAQNTENIVSENDKNYTASCNTPNDDDHTAPKHCDINEITNNTTIPSTKQSLLMSEDDDNDDKEKAYYDKANLPHKMRHYYKPDDNCKENNDCSMLINVNCFLIILLILTSSLLCYDYIIIHRHRRFTEHDSSHKIKIKYRTLLIFQSAASDKRTPYSDSDTKNSCNDSVQYNDTICRWTRSKDTDIQEFVLHFVD